MRISMGDVKCGTVHNGHFGGWSDFGVVSDMIDLP